MTLFAFLCRDGANGESLRERLLADHLAHVEVVMDKIAVAGPLKKDGKTIGSLLIIKPRTKPKRARPLKRTLIFQPAFGRMFRLNISLAWLAIGSAGRLGRTSRAQS